ADGEDGGPPAPPRWWVHPSGRQARGVEARQRVLRLPDGRRPAMRLDHPGPVRPRLGEVAGWPTDTRERQAALLGSPPAKDGGASGPVLRRPISFPREALHDGRPGIAAAASWSRI